jgi:hypothetical protein
MRIGELRCQAVRSVLVSGLSLMTLQTCCIADMVRAASSSVVGRGKGLMLLRSRKRGPNTSGRPKQHNEAKEPK